MLCADLAAPGVPSLCACEQGAVRAAWVMCSAQLDKVLQAFSPWLPARRDTEGGELDTGCGAGVVQRVAAELDSLRKDCPEVAALRRQRATGYGRDTWSSAQVPAAEPGRWQALYTDLVAPRAQRIHKGNKRMRNAAPGYELEPVRDS